MSTKVYDAGEVSIVVGAIPISAGFADGEFVRIEQQEQDFTVVVGTDGEGTRSKTNNKHTKITIRLMQSSASNAYLSALNNLDRKANNGAGIVPVLIKDRQGTSLHFAPEAWIAKPPDVSYDREAKEREWLLETVSMERLDGGN